MSLQILRNFFMIEITMDSKSEVSSLNEDTDLE